MAYVSWGTRKALGKRYSQDPALQLESERLQQEYSLIPQREARALQADQFNRSMAFNENQAALNRQAQEDANAQAGKSGMVQTGVNALTTAAMLRAATMEKGAPFFGNLFGAASSSPGVTGVTGTMAPSAITTGPTSLGLSQGIGQGLTYAPSSAATVTPALTDAGLSLAEGGATIGGVAGAGGSSFAGAGPGVDAYGLAEGVGAGEGAAAGTGAGMGVGTAASLWAAAALAGKKAFGGDKDQPYGEKNLIQKTFTSPGIAGLPGIDPGTGEVAKAVFGEDNPVTNALDWLGGAEQKVVGALTGTWLCTAIDKHVGTKADQRRAMRVLRRFTWRNHKAWLDAYLADGPTLVEGIENAENDLQAFYSWLRDRLVVPVVALVAEGNMEDAFELYKHITVDLCEKYAPEIKTTVEG